MKKLAVLAAVLLLPVIVSGYTNGGGYIGPPSIKSVISGFSTLPDSVYVAIGRQLQIYETQINANPFGDYPYTMICDADFGSIAERSFQFTPNALSTQDVIINAVLPSGDVLESKTLPVRAVAKDSGAGFRNVSFVGSSMFDTAVGELNIVGEVNSLFALDGGTNINTVGSQSIGSVYYHESHAGWTWSRFITDYKVAGVDSNTFWDWDLTNSRLDFKNYSSQYLDGAPIDAMVFYLGTNDVFGGTITSGRMSAAEIGVFVTQATAFLDTLSSATYGFPDCKALIVLPTSGSSWKSAWGNNYPNYDDLDNYLYNMEQLRQAYIAAFDNEAYSSNVDVVAAHLWLDNLEGYPYTGSAYSARVTDSLDAGTNFLHPDADGATQIADAIYSHLREWLKADTPTCTNELIDSWQFTGAAYNNIATWYDITAGQTDPFGGTKASAFTGTAATAAVTKRLSAPFTVTDDDVVASAYIKNGNLGASDITSLDFYNITIGTTYSIAVTWATPPTFTLGADADDGGLYYVGDGWWKAWLYVDMSALSGIDSNVRMYPVATPAEGDSVLCAGFQLEYGVTEPCGNYLEKP
jgi:hypothetical protein